MHSLLWNECTDVFRKSSIYDTLIVMFLICFILQENVPNVKQVLIVKPDDFWEKRRSSLSYKTSKSRHGFEVRLYF